MKNTIKKYPSFLLMSDENRFPDPASIISTLPLDSGFIFRHYSLPFKKRWEKAKALRLLCKRYGVKFLVANDPALAVWCHADGLHLSEYQLKYFSCLKPSLFLNSSFVTVAAHNFPALYRAKQFPFIDACLLSPIFPTESHPYGSSLGLSRFAFLARNSPLPLYALGGINERTISLLNHISIKNFIGVAGIGLFYTSHAYS